MWSTINENKWDKGVVRVFEGCGGVVVHYASLPLHSSKHQQWQILLEPKVRDSNPVHNNINLDYFHCQHILIFSTTDHYAALAINVTRNKGPLETQSHASSLPNIASAISNLISASRNAGTQRVLTDQPDLKLKQPWCGNPPPPPPTMPPAGLVTRKKWTETSATSEKELALCCLSASCQSGSDYILSGVRLWDLMEVWLCEELESMWLRNS